MKILHYIFSLLPVCTIVDFLDGWLRDLAATTDTGWDDLSVDIVIHALRKITGCTR